MRGGGKKKEGRRDGREANGATRGTRTSIHWHDAGRGINDPFLYRYFRCLLRIIALRRQIYRCFLFLSRDRGDVGRRAPPASREVFSNERSDSKGSEISMNFRLFFQM